MLGCRTASTDRGKYLEKWSKSWKLVFESSGILVSDQICWSLWLGFDWSDRKVGKVLCFWSFFHPQLLFKKRRPSHRSKESSKRKKSSEWNCSKGSKKDEQVNSRKDQTRLELYKEKFEFRNLNCKFAYSRYLILDGAYSWFGLIIFTSYRLIVTMAKKTTILFRLLSSAGTGFTYIGSKSTQYCLN